MMSHEYPLLKALYYSFFFFFIIHYNFLLRTCVGQQVPHSCPTSSCGNIAKISSPFRLKNYPEHCGDLQYELTCENSTAFIYLDSRHQYKYVVLAIDYSNQTINLTHPPSILQNDTCSLPSYSIPTDKFEFGSYPYYDGFRRFGSTSFVTFMSCPTPLNNSLHLEVSANCSRHNNYAAGSDTKRTYIKFGDFNGSEIMDNCTIDLITLMTPLPPLNDSKSVSLSQIHSSLLYGFQLSYWPDLCYGVGGVSSYVFPRGSMLVWFLESFNWVKVVIEYVVQINLALRIIIGMPCMLWFLIYKLRRRHLSTFDVIEVFLQSNHNLMPIRYSYRDIKKMTRGFKEKLGQGGYGSVYKGKLRSGHIVAVKLLNKPNENGQDFINEIATIGRIHHVNVVKLVGFCVGRFNNKRALVYEFMPNGSLEKHIFCQQSPITLSSKKKYEIAVGVARGIEYLHRGCDIQILHFDIKPHNILLDDNFTPKISDFGLAKLYSTENNTVTLTAARGTIGYVAPELINRSLGGVSYKADVYSFGMLLMEMVGLNKHIKVNEGESSQYFPDWIYDRFNKGKDIEMGNADDIEDADDDDDSEGHAKRITRKMTVVGLWCIQMSPADRPSMSEVVKMLESDENNVSLQIPPRTSESTHTANYISDQTWEIESSNSKALLGDYASSSSDLISTGGKCIEMG